ncbi:MAG: SagB/ThcOx family dehydrogenase [Chthonomonadales bacterium]|nr:SagB/ThcOx family dehydrogenase [Chthonomonadales bacterium]
MRYFRVTVMLTALALAGISIAALRQGGSAPLPKPNTSGGMSLTEALAKRRSCTAYTDKPLSPEQIGQLCWAAQGITEPAKGLRTAPSAMTLYSVHVYIVDSAGVHEYLPKEHALSTLRADDLVAGLQALVGKPANMGGAPSAMVLGVHLAPLAERVGARAEKFAAMEAAHIAQNVLLQATALGLGSIPVGGFDEARVSDLLKLPEGIRPIYILPLGTPKG